MTTFSGTAVEIITLFAQTPPALPALWRIDAYAMLPTFLAQFAAGCYLVISVSSIRHCSWRYLRLMAVVSMAMTVLGGALLFREAGWRSGDARIPAAFLLAAAGAGAAWLFVNAAQGQRVRDSQRIWPSMAGAACLVAAVMLAIRPDELLARPAAVSAGFGGDVARAASTLLGAALLGVVTCGMLLGHRYLTDVEMPIAPLRRLARFFIVAAAARIAWAVIAGWPVWFGSFRPDGDIVWFWLMVTVRVGVGLIGAAVFAAMVWDCVRRRATQSATALFYFSMVFVFLGELAGQYLMRTASLPC